MTVPPREAYPTGCSAHGARERHTIVITITITIIVTACAGLSPEWATAIAALITTTSGSSQP